MGALEWELWEGSVAMEAWGWECCVRNNLTIRAIGVLLVDFCGDFAIVLGLYRFYCILELCQQYFCLNLLIGVFGSAFVCCVCHCFILLLWFCHVIWFTL